MKKEVQVSEATIEHARGIAQVLVDGWKTTYAGILPAAFLDTFNYDSHEVGTRQHLEHLPASSAVFVACAENGSVLGVAHVREVTADTRDVSAELDAIYVLPTAQRRRVGTHLLRSVVQWLEHRGHRSMFLWVLRDNPYRSFYQRLGGELLNEQRLDDFAGAQVTSVTYIWRDLEALRHKLEEQIRR